MQGDDTLEIASANTLSLDLMYTAKMSTLKIKHNQQISRSQDMHVLFALLPVLSMYFTWLLSVTIWTSVPCTEEVLKDRLLWLEADYVKRLYFWHRY